MKKYARGVSHPKFYRGKLKHKVIALIVKNPNLGITEIAKQIKAGRHAVYNLLIDLKLTTQVSRANFAKLYDNPRVLDTSIKIPAVRKVINNEDTITNVAKELNVARKTIYAWINEYKKEGNINNTYAKGFDHPKSLGAIFEREVLIEVAKAPNLSIHALAKNLGYAVHGVYNVLKRNNLNFSYQRLAYAQNNASLMAQPQEYKSTGIFDRVRSVLPSFSPNFSPAPPPVAKTFLASAISSTLFFYLILQITSFGMFLAFIALFSGMLFFVYSLKYYMTLGLVLSFSQNQERQVHKNFLSWILGRDKGTSEQKDLQAIGLNPDMDSVILNEKPFVSIHVALFNEKNVVERISRAVTSFDYPEYEVILADDSNDETSQKITDFQKKFLFKNEQLNVIKGDGWILRSVEVKPNVYLRHLHRQTRDGYKGKALELALKLTDKRAKYISIFDADFVPYPDSLQLFLKYFQQSDSSQVAAVQGYQWHVLNKSENWITRGVRSEYSGSYVVERSGAEIYGGLKQISGSVYMIKKDILAEIGWGTSITEDFELTLKLYEKGYKVLYTPYVQAPAECVSTLTRLIRQRMRWAEGHSFNVKKMFAKLMLSPNLTKAEKLEFLYLTPYYLQAFFFLLGTFAWFISETIFKVRLPFWTETWGWSLVITNMISLPLLNAVGLFMEESEQKDYSGLGSFVALSYIVVPFQAYAAVKGFIEKEEGPWFRTPKTGRITDLFTRGRFMRFVQEIMPVKTNVMESKYLTLTSANSKFNGTSIKRSKNTWTAKAFLSLLLVFTISINYLAIFTLKTSPPVASAKSENSVTQLTDNNNALSLDIKKNEYQAGIALASEGDKYEYSTNLEQSTYSFGLIDEKGTKPVVKIETKSEELGDNFVSFEPTDTNFVEAKVDKNKIEWNFKNGIKARYKSLEDRIKADYIIYDKNQIENGKLSFNVKFNENKNEKRYIVNTPDGYVSLMSEAPTKEIFRFDTPTIEDDNGVDGQIKFEVAKTGVGKALLSLVIDQKFLDTATYPIIVDPTVLTASGASTSTAYGNGKLVFRNSDNDYVACYIYTSSSMRCAYSNNAGSSWQEKNIGITGTFVSISGDIDTSTNNVYLTLEDSVTGIRSVKISDMTTSNDIDSTWTVSTPLTLDSSLFGHKPSTIYTKMGSSDHIAVAWGFYGSSKGTKRTGVRFMQCLGSNTCTSIANWCKASDNSGANCGTAASSISADGTTDAILTLSSSGVTHAVLNQQAPTGSSTYAKALVVVAGADDTADIGTAYTQWGTVDWGTWTTSASNITASAWNSANDFGLSMAQDTLNNSLILSWYDSTNSKIQTYKNNQIDAPTGAVSSSWFDRSFPTGNNKQTSIGVDNTNGLYYDFYKNATGNIAMRQGDSASLGTSLGGSTLSTNVSIVDTLVASKISVSTTGYYSNMMLFEQASPLTCKIRAGLYSDSSGVPGVLLAQTEEVTGVLNQNILNFDSLVKLTAGTDYWVSVIGDVANCTVWTVATGGTSYSSSQAYTAGDSLPVTFPSGTSGTYSHYIQIQANWSPEIVLDQSATNLAYPSITEGYDATNKKMDLIYTGGASPYSVYAHTWHQDQRYSSGAITAANSALDNTQFLDENGYSNVSADDSIRENAPITTNPSFIFKVKNTDRTNYPQISATWNGQSTSTCGTGNDCNFQIYDRSISGWSTCSSDITTGANTDFTLTCSKTTSLDNYYFADNWVYFRVYQSIGSTPTFKTDYFNPSPFSVPDNTLVLLLFIPLMPKIISTYRKRRAI